MKTTLMVPICLLLSAALMGQDLHKLDKREKLLAKGDRLLGEQKYDKAFESYHEAWRNSDTGFGVRDRHDTFTAYWGMGVAREAQGKYKDAVDYFIEAYKLFPIRDTYKNGLDPLDKLVSVYAKMIGADQSSIEAAKLLVIDGMPADRIMASHEAASNAIQTYFKRGGRSEDSWYKIGYAVCQRYRDQVCTDYYSWELMRSAAITEHIAEWKARQAREAAEPRDGRTAVDDINCIVSKQLNADRVIAGMPEVPLPRNCN